MKNLFALLITGLLLMDAAQSQTTTYNWNGAIFYSNTTGARRSVIGRVYYNQYHWGAYGNIKFTIRSQVFKSAQMEYLLMGNPDIAGQIPVLYCLMAAGTISQYAKLELGPQTNAGNEYSGGVNYYRDIYFDADYYTQWYIEATATGSLYGLDKFSISSGEYGYLTLFSSPATENIANFYPHQKKITIPGYMSSFWIDGNTGIGTSDPVSRLDVRVSTIDYTAGSVLSSYPIANFINNGSGNGQRGLQIGAPTGGIGSPVYLKVSGTSNRLGFLNQFDAENVSILENGHVGIGTTTPSEKLSVNGNIRTKKLIVSQSGWPDYVFSPDYKLRPLKELDAFIRRNKHLPGMPSAKEVEENGISVGDNQALLLKKIEELTLYIIKQEEKIQETGKRLQHRIDELSKKLEQLQSKKR